MPTAQFSVQYRSRAAPRPGPAQRRVERRQLCQEVVVRPDVAPSSELSDCLQGGPAALQQHVGHRQHGGPVPYLRTDLLHIKAQHNIIEFGI